MSPEPRRRLTFTETLRLLREDPGTWNALADDPAGRDLLTLAPPASYRYETPTEPWRGTAGILDRAGMEMMKRPGVAMVMADSTGAETFSREECDLAERDQRAARPDKRHNVVDMHWIAATARPRLAPTRMAGCTRERRPSAARSRGSRRRSGSSPPSSDDSGDSDEPGEARHHLDLTPRAVVV